MRLNKNSASEWKHLPLEVAQKRLLEVRGQSDALEAIREIVTHLVGSEEMGLFTLDAEGALLSLFWSFGLDADRFRKVGRLRNPVLAMVLAGEPYIEGTLDDAGNCDPIFDFKALVPIRLDGKTVAILAIRRLLPQKTRFDESDLQLFRFLSSAAGKSVFGQTRRCGSGGKQYGCQ